MTAIQIHPNHTVILACSSLLLHVAAAQTKMHTHFPVIELDRRLHADPNQMRNHILEKLVSGQWDEQFVVLESTQEMTERDFGLSAGPAAK